MAFKDPEGFAAGVKYLEETAAEIQAELQALPGICKQCVEDGGGVWPKDTSMYCSGHCQSCDGEEDTILVPYEDIEDAPCPN